MFDIGKIVLGRYAYFRNAIRLLAAKTIDIGNIVLGRHAYFRNAISS